MHSNLLTACVNDYVSSHLHCCSDLYFCHCCSAVLSIFAELKKFCLCLCLDRASLLWRQFLLSVSVATQCRKWPSCTGISIHAFPSGTSCFLDCSMHFLCAVNSVLLFSSLGLVVCGRSPCEGHDQRRHLSTMLLVK